MESIITKYLEGRASEAEQKELLEWLRDKNNLSNFNNYSLVWNKGLDKKQLPDGSEPVWNNIQAHFLVKSYSGWQKSRKINIIFRIAAIFFFTVCLGGGVYLYYNLNSSQEYFTHVMAEKGQISKVQLPDGSNVWLNSGSEVVYNNYFGKKNRDITLTGEAYFQVAKNENIPMIVNSRELQLKVIGTKFNFSAYPESNSIAVVLESGSVELLHSDVKAFRYKLKPGERALFKKQERKLAVSNVNTKKFTAWKEGIMNIYDQSLEELAKKLEVRYNQKFVVSENVKNYHYTFTIKSESLDEIIELMEKITPVKAFQKQDTITFKLDRNKKRLVED